MNTSGTTYTGLKMTVYVWGSVNTGTVNAGAPAFGNLLGSYTITSTGSFASGYYFSDEGSPVGTNPGETLSSPLSISSTTIGLTFNIQGTTDGTTYISVNSLTSLISYGVTPTVGADMFNGYYRNANSENNGNFTSTLRSLGQADQSLAVRIYGITSVPEPGVASLLGLGGLMLLRFRRKA